MCPDLKEYYLPLENSCADLTLGIIKNKKYFYDPGSIREQTVLKFVIVSS